MKPHILRSTVAVVDYGEEGTSTRCHEFQLVANRIHATSSCCFFCSHGCTYLRMVLFTNRSTASSRSTDAITCRCGGEDGKKPNRDRHQRSETIFIQHTQLTRMLQYGGKNTIAADESRKIPPNSERVLARNARDAGRSKESKEATKKQKKTKKKKTG